MFLNLFVLAFFVVVCFIFCLKFNFCFAATTSMFLNLQDSYLGNNIYTLGNILRDLQNY